MDEEADGYRSFVGHEIDLIEQCEDICASTPEAESLHLNNERDCYRHSQEKQKNVQKLIFDQQSHTCFNFDPRDELMRT